MRILIADDHSLIRKGLKQILSEKSNTDVIEARDSKEVFQQLKKFDVQAIVLDISLPGKNGIEILKDVKVLYPHIAVLILSVYPEEQYGIRALKSGASGYLTKDSAPENLIEAIEKVIAGGKYISPFIAEKLISELTGDSSNSDNPHEKLSDREFEVLKSIGHGSSPTEIAENLSLSVKTISTYRSRILQKMGLKNNAELIQYVIKNDL
ncbi:MAG: response regulator transcription factor [Flavobacteriales bacterium]|nr:response regulator transcription factor [Flavobacteriales bacterium]